MWLEKIKPYALDCYEKYHVLPSQFIGHATKETGWGKHVFHNNYMGIKCHNPDKFAGCRIGKTSEYYNGDIHHNLKLAFQTYTNYEECMDDYGRIMTSGGYYKQATQADNYWKATALVIKGGYSTGFTYLRSWRKLIESNHWYLLDGFVKGKRADISQADLAWQAMEGMTSSQRKNFLLTPNFKYSEFWDVGGTVEPDGIIFHNIFWMALQLQEIRDIIKREEEKEYPISVTSAVRNVYHNRKVRGIKGSNHIMALAVDSRCGIGLMKYFYYLAKYSSFTGIGIYKRKNFIHTDFGSNIPLRIWEG